MKFLMDKPYKKSSPFFYLLLFIIIIVYGYVLSSKHIPKANTKAETPSIYTSIRVSALLEQAKLEQAKLEQAKLEQAKLEQAKLEQAKLEQAKLEQANRVSRGGEIDESNVERETINGYVREIAAKYNISPYLIMSIIVSESDYNPKCTTGNCVGLMQVSTVWQRERAMKLGVKDFYDPYSNILIGVDCLSDLLKYNNNETPLALMLYNMRHDTARNLYSQGIISKYAKTVIARAEEFEKGE